MEQIPESLDVEDLHVVLAETHEAVLAAADAELGGVLEGWAGQEGRHVVVHVVVDQPRAGGQGEEAGFAVDGGPDAFYGF
jgi:hypothetical protein